MYTANRSANRQNVLLSKVEADMERTKEKLTMYFGPLARLEQVIQDQADFGNLLTCQIQYLNTAMSADRDTDFNELYEEYKSALEKN